MAFTLHTSNRTEHLLEHLATVIESQPLRSVFDQEVFLIQSQGMERWLLQGLSDRFGVMANYEFLFPNKFFNQISLQVCSEQSLKPEHFARERLVWVVDGVLKDIRDESLTEFGEVLRYLKDDQGKKRFQLAQQLTQLFDQYQIFRPFWMEPESVPDLTVAVKRKHWTLQIWRRVLKRIEDDQHIGQMWFNLMQALHDAEVGSFQDLPPRISVFGIHSMPEVFVKVLQCLSKHIDVHIYLTQPTKGYWADIRSRSQTRLDQLMQRVSSAEIVKLDAFGQQLDASSEHPLLSLLGQQGRDFHKLLLATATFHWEFDSTEQDIEAETILSSIQHAILHNIAQPQLTQADDSLQVVSCHSRLREVEVVKDAILRQLQHNPELELRNIAVMAPNITDYQPFIDAVFSGSDMPYAIADKAPQSGNEVYATLLSVLELLPGRFAWSEVVDVLERPLIQSFLNISSADVEQMVIWIEHTNIRWGKSSAHRASMGLPALSLNTWEAGIAQMMLGFAMQGQNVSIEGGQLALLEKLDFFVRECLFVWSEQASTTKTLAQWEAWLSELILRLFDPQHPLVQELIRTFAQLKLDYPCQDVLNNEHELSTIIAWLDNAISERKSSQGFMAGQLTFCSMLPMRSIPFEVVCVLGLNDGEFPRAESHRSFDLMANDFQLGDRSVRVDDRYQFLEVLLSARSHLHLSYVGQSQKKLQAIPPSVVVQELLDVLGVNVEHFVIQHPLQPFAKRYFVPQSRVSTFAQHNAQIAQQIDDQSDDAAWVELPLSTNSHQCDVIDLHDLMSFACHPQRWFMKERLGVRLNNVDSMIAPHEPFAIGPLDRYQLNQTIFQRFLEGAGTEVIANQLYESGQWVSGQVGKRQLIHQIKHVERFATAVKQTQMDNRSDVFSVDVEYGQYRIQGTLPNYYASGFIQARFSTLKTKDFIKAGLVCAITEQPVYLYGAGAGQNIVTKEFAKVLMDLPLLLKMYVDAYNDPLQYWPELAWSWLTTYHSPQSAKLDEDERRFKAHSSALKQFESQRGIGFKAIPDDDVIRITQGRSFEQIWHNQSQHLSIECIKDIFFASKGVRS